MSSKAKTDFRQRRDENSIIQNNEGPSHPPNDVEYAEVNEVAEIQPTNTSRSNALSQERPVNSYGNILETPILN